MLNIERTHAAVVACYASPQALDSLSPTSGVHKFRVAPDELLLIGPPGLLADTTRGATEHFGVSDPTALVLDQSDGWSTFTLRGDEAQSIFAQLSVVPLPSRGPASVQGAIAGGSAKIMLLDDAIHVLVPSTLGDYLAGRLNDVCGGRTIVPTTETAFANETATTPFQNGAAVSALR